MFPQNKTRQVGRRPPDPADPADPADPPFGVTARRTEPGKHAHTFRMTLVSRDKLPQTNSRHGVVWDAKRACYLHAKQIQIIQNDATKLA